MKIETVDQLRELYGQPSGRAKIKSLPALEKHSVNFIEKSPFVLIATVDKQGKMDTSPRGGSPGFIAIINQNEIVIPDAKGNNRVDSLTNIVETGRIGMLFLIPGIDETLRLNGSASINTAARYLDLFTAEKNPPKSCIVITVEEVFIHCAKAFMRSKLWDAGAKFPKKNFPSIGQILKDQLNSDGTPETRESMEERYKKDL